MKKFFILILFVLEFFPLQIVRAQCTYCSAGTQYEWEFIDGVYIGDISNKGTKWQNGVADYTNLSTKVLMGNSYDIKVTSGKVYSGDIVSVHVDWNKDCDFDDANEVFTLSTSDGAASFTGKIIVPSSAVGGITRMRIRMTDDGTAQACGTDYYGEVEDYSLEVILPSPDAGVANVIPPTYPYLEGTWPVSMVLGSYGDAAVTSCIIHWSVNGVEQTPYNWSGTLKKDQTTQILLGNYAFLYPDGGPYDPFSIRVWLTNIVGSGTALPDADPTNNEKTVKTSPMTEDAQPVSISKPSGSFTPGNQQIAVTIRNNARKPLTVVDIDWYVDGVKQGTKKWFGSLSQNQTAEVVVGTYNFTFKTPLAPFTIKAQTINPNGVSDPVPGNDIITRDVAPSLVAGTFTVGGSNAHFPTLAECINYLNSSGIIGDGDVHIKINSGTYNEQVGLIDFPHGNNNFYFESASGYASDVNISFAPMYPNYIWGINGLSNVYFQNLTFTAQDYGYGSIIYASNVNNLNFSNVIFNGAAGYDIINLDYCNNVNITGCTFYTGNNPIYFTTDITPSLTIKNNTFKNFTGTGITMNSYYQGGKINPKKDNNIILAGDPIVIDNNEFNGPGYSGITISEPAKITNNKFVGFTSTSYGFSAIDINTMSPYATTIQNNSISNMVGVSGISVITASGATIQNNSVAVSGYAGVPVNGIFLAGNSNLLYNKVTLSGIAGLQNIGLYTQNASGIVANNLINTTNGNAFNASTSNNLEVYYNTFIANSQSFPAAEFYFGQNTFMRNLVSNYGINRSVVNNSSNINSANNNFWTKGNSNSSDLTSYVNTTGDNTSTNIAVELTDDGTYRYSTFVPELVTYDPLGLGDVENTDYYGNTRDGFYYAGYAGIVLEINIIKQPEALLACNGSTGNSLQVAATISYGAQAEYQWEKDGVPIPGATNPIYKFGAFNYETTGTYRCKVYGPANTKDGIYSNEVLVYTLRNTEITKQPQDVTANLGETAVFEVEVHIKGIVPPYFQHKYQWYRHYNGEDIQLLDNEYYANTKSPIMTITNLKDMHFSGTDDYYFVVVEGLCGTVTSNPVHLILGTSTITFTEDPVDTKVCVASKAVFTANAVLNGGNDPINYQWYFNGAALVDDARISGATTSTLTIMNVGYADEGNYYCEASSPNATTVASKTAKLTIMLPPMFDVQPTDATLVEGEKLTLTATASGEEPITYQWYKDDVMINGATENTFIIDGVLLTDAGFYYCEATNECGKTKSTIAQVVVNKSGGVLGVTDNNPINLAITPNPAISDLNITFTLNENSQVEIAILDMSGKKVATKLTNAVAGFNNITMSLNNTFASGTYFVQVTYNGQSVTKQIIVTK
jgi:hypothetical protein